MDRSGTNNLLERILSATQPVTVLLGPCASGKTSAAMDFYRHFVNPAGQARCIFLTPNSCTQSSLRRMLLDQAPRGVLRSPRVTGFSALAGNILAASGQTVKIISPLKRRVLLRQIVDKLHTAGKLAALYPVADTPGLITALDRAIAELKRAAIEPDDLAAACDRSNGRSRDLVSIYRKYQQHLLAEKVYDVEGQMWQARAQLEQAQSLPADAVGMDNVDALVADGFTDFTPTQLQMLNLLSRRVKRVLITLPHSADGRERMWHWTARTLANIRRILGSNLNEITLEPSTALPLANLAAAVFNHDAPPAQLPQGLELIVASSLDAEVSAVARRVKRLLLDGTPGGKIAVLARSLDAYRPAIRRIFPACGIPVCDEAEVLTESPIVRFALDAASLGEKFPFHNVLRIIKSSYFRPQAMGEFTPADAALAEMAIREGNVLEGRPAYAQAVERLADAAARKASREDTEEPSSIGPLPASPADIRRAGELLEKLFSLVAQGLGPVLSGLQLRQAAMSLEDPPLVARDLRAMEILHSALDELGRPWPPLPELIEALSVVSVPPARGQSVVDVLDVLDARALRYDHVFLLGAGEGQFPQSLSEGSLIGEADRANWAARGITLDSRRDLAAREMLLFYLATSRADKTTVVSYLESDASGKTGAPSVYLLSLLESIGGIETLRKSNRVEHIAPGEFLSSCQLLASPRQALLAAVAGLFQENASDFSPALAWVNANAPRHLYHAAAGLWARACRWKRSPCDEFDGRLADPDLLQRLAWRFPSQTVFSATMLNTFGQCPWQFFAKYILKLKPLELPQREIEAVSRGEFCHEVLFEFFTRMRDQLGGPVQLADLTRDRIEAVLDQALASASADVEIRKPSYPVLWEIQRKQMRGELNNYLQSRRNNPNPPGEAVHFELAFGVKGKPADHADSASREEPIAMATPTGTVRVRGKIDRVDRLQDKSKWFVVDYKAASLPSDKDIHAGRNLQMPIYTEAVGQLLGGPIAGGAFHSLADPGETRNFSDGGKSSKYGDLTARRIHAAETIGQFVAAMSQGRFDALPTGKCPGYCPFRQVCHYSDARMPLKADLTRKPAGAANVPGGEDTP